MRAYERDVRRLAATHGAELVGKTSGGHLLIVRQDGGRVFAAATPSDWRALRNVEKDLTRPRAKA